MEKQLFNNLSLLPKLAFGPSEGISCLQNACIGLGEKSPIIKPELVEGGKR